MREMFIGEYIRQNRQNQGLSQEKLCEGICEPMTLSRLENGKQTPSRNRIKALLQRLGLPDDRYFALLNKYEIEVNNIQRDLGSAISNQDIPLGWEKVRELEAIVEKDDQITRQLILRAKAVLGRRDGTYSQEEARDMLLEALRITVPRFDLEDINQCRYCLEEVKIINSIANIYSVLGDNKKAANIFSQLLKYVEKHYWHLSQAGAILALVAFNYSRVLDLVKRYEDAIEVAEIGRYACIKFGHYESLPDVLAVMAECRYFLGEREESARLYTQAYYLYQAIDNKRDLAVIADEAKRYLEIEFIYQ